MLYGTELPAGGLGLDESVNVPVLSLPPRVGRLAAEAVSRHERPAISIGVPRIALNGTAGEVAPFSSRGLAFDGRVKPDLIAPGVVVATSEPGANDDGTPRFGTVNGSSAAAAVVAGAAAVLAQARPALGALDVRSLLTGTARSLRDTTVTAQGAGLLDLGAASAGELASDPVTLAFGRAEGDGWHSVAGAPPAQRLVEDAARPRARPGPGRAADRVEAEVGAAQARRPRERAAHCPAPRRAPGRRLGGRERCC